MGAFRLAKNGQAVGVAGRCNLRACAQSFRLLKAQNNGSGRPSPMGKITNKQDHN